MDCHFTAAGRLLEVRSLAHVMGLRRTGNWVSKSDCKEQKGKMGCRQDQLHNWWDLVHNENVGPLAQTLSQISWQ